MSNYKNILKIQIKQLQLALSYATTIEKCDEGIEQGMHVNYFKSVRAEAIEKYADAVADIIENSIDIAVQFQSPKTKPFDEMLLAEFDRITRDYARAEGIGL